MKNQNRLCSTAALNTTLVHLQSVLMILQTSTCRPNNSSMWGSSQRTFRCAVIKGKLVLNNSNVHMTAEPAKKLQALWSH
jgi:hypothetical protein